MAAEEPVVPENTDEVLDNSPDAPEGNEQEVAATWDESKLIRGKGGRVIKPTRPDDTERNIQISKLKEEMDKYSARIVEIKKIIDDKLANSKGQSGPQTELRNKLGALRSEWQTALRNKQRLQVENNDLKTEREAALNELRALRDSTRGPLDPAALEQRIQELDFKLTHETLNPQEEKRLREQKEKMERQDRPAVAKYAALQKRLDDNKSTRDALRARLEEADAQLKGIKVQEDDCKAQLDALRAQSDEGRADLPALHAEKKEAYEIIQALRAKQGEIRAAFDARWKEFIAQSEAFRAWAADDRRKRQEQRKKEFEERQAARKAAALAAAPDKWAEKMYTCDQVLTYLRKYIEAEQDPAAAVGAGGSSMAEAPAPGMKLLVKKDDDDLANWFGGKGKKGKNAKRQEAKAAGASAAPKKLHHTMESLKTFLTLGVEAPHLAADVPKTIEAVEAKKAEYAALKEKAAATGEDEEELAEEEPEEAPEPAPVPPSEPEPEPASTNGFGPSEAVAPATQGAWAARSAGKAAAAAAAAGKRTMPAPNAAGTPVGVSLQVSGDGISLRLQLA